MNIFLGSLPVFHFECNSNVPCCVYVFFKLELMLGIEKVLFFDIIWHLKITQQAHTDEISYGYLPGGVQARETERGPNTVTLWGGWIPVGQDDGVCIEYFSLTAVPPSVLASSSYTYLRRRWQNRTRQMRNRQFIKWNFM